MVGLDVGQRCCFQEEFLVRWIRTTAENVQESEDFVLEY